MSKRLTKARIRKWDKDSTDLRRRIRIMRLDVNAYKLAAKGGRYSYLLALETALTEAQAVVTDVMEEVEKLGTREGVFE